MTRIRSTALTLLVAGVVLAGCNDEAEDKKTKTEEDAGLAVSSAQARACDVLFEDTDQVEVTAVSFGDGVQGTFVREGRRTAASFFSTADAPIPDGAVQVRTAGAGVDTLKIARVACADRKGEALADVELTLNL